MANPNMSITLISARVIAWVYTITVIAAGLFAWVMDIRLLHDNSEHMLPDMIFLLTALPLSLTLDLAYDLQPSLFNKPFAQLVYVTLCATIQAGILWWLVRWLKTHPQTKRAAA